ncbi:MAG: hypothetical protein Kow00109_26270 [Acidobacteriota bacterium]
MHGILGEQVFRALEKLEQHGSTGFLELRDPSGEEKITIFLYDGRIEGASSSREEHRLGHYLIRDEVLTEATLRRLLERAGKEKKRLGQILVEERLIGRHDLEEYLVRQLVDAIHRVMDHGYEIVGFFGSTETRMHYRLAASAFRAALETARRRPLTLRLEPHQGLELVNASSLRPTSWTPEELSILSLLRYPQPLGQLLEVSTLRETEVMQILQTLLDLGMLRIVERIPPQETALVKKERLPLESLVPRVSDPKLDPKVAMVNEEFSLITEQFRTLKVRLQSQAEPPVRLLTVTSPLPQDGKSLIATSLALSFSREPGRRTLLIDADLRGASVHEKLGIDMAPGLYQYLVGTLDPQCYIRRVEDLYVMTAGYGAENAVELLSLSRMRDLLRFAAEQFDNVILDAPPVLPIADARIISQLTEATVMVIHQGKTPYRLIERALEAIDRRKLLGVVLNGVRTTGINGYYTYSYYYAYPYYFKGKSKDGVIELKARPRSSRHSGSTLLLR